MKHMKRIFALALAVMMVMSLAITASAAGEKFTITIPAGDTHKYEIYQIFTGDYYEEGTQRILSNIVWGKNGSGTKDEAVPEAILNELSAATGGDKDKLAVISKYVRLTDPYATVDGGAEAKNVSVDPGYYLIKDVNASITGDDAYTTYIVKVVDDVTVTRKVAKPEVNKQVLDETADAEAGHEDGWGETADHAINETFQFKLIATLDDDVDFDAYKTYKVVFNDTMSAGITFDSIASVKVDGIDLTVDQYTETVDANQAGGSWSLTIADIKAIAGVNLTDGAVIEVIYNAHLNENAVIGDKDDNKNTVNLQYSNNPNAGGENELGKTPDDTVWVFTYEMDNTKVDGSNQPLGGAGFKLYADEACTNEIAVIYDESLKAYRLAKTGETGVEMLSAAQTGVFNIVGLDVGTYYLKETTTPDGYNTCPVVKVEITATHAEAESETTASTTITMTQDGKATDINKIVNKSGTTLPETGGIGTTIFYSLGGILVLVAVVLLVTKKRMASAE